MKRSASILSMMTFAVLTGCTQGTPGGPGTTESKSSLPTYGQKDDTFNLSVPTETSILQQGEHFDVSIGIKRAKNFDSDVGLKFGDLPKGVTVEPADAMIKHGDTDTTITFKATDIADLGQFKVKIAGHPTEGGDAHIELKLSVTAKDSFKLSPPAASTSLKQGESKTISIGIKRDKTFDQDVALTFGDLPTGVTLEPIAPTIKQGDTEAQLTLTSADDASLGNFAIKVTGHPATGAEATDELKLTVVKQ